MAKLLVSDYDDTFFTDEKSLKENIEKIKNFRKNGNLFVIATSRSYLSIMEEIQKYQIPYDYVVFNVGAGIFDQTGKILYKNYISKKEKENVEKILDKYPELKITRYGITEEQSKVSNEIMGYKIKGDGAILKNVAELFKTYNTSFNVSLKETENKLFLNHVNNTKEHAIQELVAMFPEIRAFDVITVGDDDVDFGMLKAYDGYRMEISSELLLKNIYKIVSSVGELVENCY